MLRVAIYFENRLGRNDGNPLYIYAALKRLEEKGELIVDHLIPDGNYKLFGKYDAHIVVDWGEDGLTSLLPYKVDYNFGDGIKVYWASDTHIGEESYNYRLDTASKFDIAFVAQKKAVQAFQKDGVEATWLPHAVEPYAYCDEDYAIRSDKKFSFLKPHKPYDLLSKKHDIGFVGHISSPNRVEALDRMFREFPNFYYGQKLFNQAARKYAESKIVFNIAMKDDLNMRVFEALGSKSFLLTDNVSSITDLFEDGKHLALYSSLDEAVEKAHYYLSNEYKRKRIAQAGYDEVMSKHTIDHRLSVILNAINKKLESREVQIVA